VVGEGRGRVRIYEVGPRDGLQAEATPLSTATKRRFIELLLEAGLREVEATSFVSPKAIPQLADADELLPSLPRGGGARFPVLVPNERGLRRAEAAGAEAIAVFTAATDAYAERNIGMSVAESLTTFAPILRESNERGWWTRAYVSTAFGCPYTGRVDPQRAVEVSLRLADLGAAEIAVSDTIGVAVPDEAGEMVERLTGAGLPLERLAFHFHDTRGTALANVYAGLQAGVRCFDASTGGTGGSPFAPGAAGNLATEDLVYLLDGSGYEHGVDLAGVLAAARFISAALGRPLQSKVGLAGGWDAGRPKASAHPARMPPSGPTAAPGSADG
jgi:isopropylmalate/homocitrate/citramalate synthase